MSANESIIERELISKLEDIKYTYRPDIRDRATLERNFREKFEALNRVSLTEGEFIPVARRAGERPLKIVAGASAKAILGGHYGGIYANSHRYISLKTSTCV